MHTVLNEGLPFNLGSIDYSQWQSSMFDRLQRWYNDVLQETDPSETGKSNIAPPEVLELSFHRAVVFLYRPSSMIPSPSSEALQVLAESAMSVIKLYKRFYRENKLRLFWQAVKTLFDAATALMYCYVHSVHVREWLPLRTLESHINSSSNILWGMVERYPALKGKRDAFDDIAATFFSDVNNSQTPLGNGNVTGPPSWPGSSGESQYGRSFSSQAMEGLAFNNGVMSQNQEMGSAGGHGGVVPSYPSRSIDSEPEQQSQSQTSEVSLDGPARELGHRSLEIGGQHTQMYDYTSQPMVAWEDLDTGSVPLIPMWDWET